MSRDKEEKIEKVLFVFGNKCKQNINGGRVFHKELKEMCAIIRQEIEKIINAKES